MVDQINVNEIANTLQTKVDLPDGVSQTQCDFVIEWKAPTSADPTWYRLYKSGWVEQGGWTSNAGVTSGGWTKTINLLIPMSDTNYHIMRTADKNSIANDPGSRWIAGANGDSKTTTQFTIFTDQVGYVYGDWWEVRGFAAIN